jgi:hypothetical protein
LMHLGFASVRNLLSCVSYALVLPKAFSRKTLSKRIRERQTVRGGQEKSSCDEQE